MIDLDIMTQYVSFDSDLLRSWRGNAILASRLACFSANLQQFETNIDAQKSAMMQFILQDVMKLQDTQNAVGRAFNVVYHATE